MTYTVDASLASLMIFVNASTTRRNAISIVFRSSPQVVVSKSLRYCFGEKYGFRSIGVLKQTERSLLQKGYMHPEHFQIVRIVYKSKYFRLLQEDALTPVLLCLDYLSNLLHTSRALLQSPGSVSQTWPSSRAYEIIVEADAVYLIALHIHSDASEKNTHIYIYLSSF